MTPERFRLGALPTPLTEAPRLGAAVGIERLLIKRDDLTGFGLGGNKIRKLEYLIGDALAAGADRLVVMGGPSSNMCRAAALAARVAGLGCELVLYGDPPSHPPTSLRLARRFGATVHFTGDPIRESVEVVARERVEELARHGSRPYLVPRGGATAIGAVGYHTAVVEVSQQLAEYGIDEVTVVVPLGSGGTLAGILSGVSETRQGWSLVGASVSRHPAEARQQVVRVATECAGLLGTSDPTWSGRVIDARGDGYGQVWEPARTAGELALDTEGLLLDQTYTAKTLAVVIGLAEETTGPVLWWHTGGGPAAVDGILKENTACH